MIIASLTAAKLLSKNTISEFVLLVDADGCECGAPFPQNGSRQKYCNCHSWFRADFQNGQNGRCDQVWAILNHLGNFLERILSLALNHDWPLSWPKRGRYLLHWPEMMRKFYKSLLPLQSTFYFSDCQLSSKLQHGYNSTCLDISNGHRERMGNLVRSISVTKLPNLRF